MSSIINEYIGWLREYKSRGGYYSKLAKKLINDLKEIHVIADLEATLSGIPRPSFPMTLFGKNEFFLKLDDWQEEIINRQEAYIKALGTINEVESSSDIHKLITFIRNTLNGDDCLLHIRGLSLFKILEDAEQLKETLEYLASLPEVDPPDDPRQNTFDAIVPDDEEHAACLRLLRNNSADFHSNYPANRHANSLLQTVLLIYQDTVSSSQLKSAKQVRTF
ncbi:hypothetical protein FOG18_11770 [Legionella israelensis]|uniref:hypothetical protein n=1 Tax=Legionella israelensis TaxID=454 RepID=UPI00117C4A3A|nr:hypothetical protein [Legionella israelensis]QDP73189.1 hypothetical protein FOG18_11770 [Legionella israelensis]